MINVAHSFEMYLAIWKRKHFRLKTQIQQAKDFFFFCFFWEKKLHNWFIMTEGISLQLVPKSLSDSSALNAY